MKTIGFWVDATVSTCTAPVSLEHQKRLWPSQTSKQLSTDSLLFARISSICIPSVAGIFRVARMI